MCIGNNMSSIIYKSELAQSVQGILNMYQTGAARAFQGRGSGSGFEVPMQIRSEVKNSLNFSYMQCPNLPCFYFPI